MKNTQNSIILGTHTLEEVINAKQPERTDSYHTVSNETLINTLKQIVSEQGFIIKNEQYGLSGLNRASNNYTKMVGVWLLEKPLKTEGKKTKKKTQEQEKDEIFVSNERVKLERLLFFKQSHDKSEAIILIPAGYIEEYKNPIIINSKGNSRRHTSGLNLEKDVTNIVRRLDEQFASLNERIIKLENQPVDNERVEKIILEMGKTGVIPSSRILPILDIFNNDPLFNSLFKKETQWKLYNAVARQANDLQINHYLTYHSGTSAFFSLNQETIVSEETTK